MKQETIIKYIEKYQWALSLITLVGLLMMAGWLFYQPPSTKIIEKEVEVPVTVKPLNRILVDIKGAVAKPGVYETSVDGRVINVIEQAGGLLKTADTSYLNLAKKVTDMMVIMVYNHQEVKTMTTPVTLAPLTNDALIKDNLVADNSLININTASLDALMTLPGIGETKAKAIINYRTKQLFKTIDELMDVEGIGDATFNQIKSLITI